MQLFCSIVQSLEAGGQVTLGTLMMDDDSTTIARIRSEMWKSGQIYNA